MSAAKRARSRDAADNESDDEDGEDSEDETKELENGDENKQRQVLLLPNGRCAPNLRAHFPLHYAFLVANPNLNPGVNPETLGSSSPKKLTWICPDHTTCGGHRWVQSPHSLFNKIRWGRVKDASTRKLGRTAPWRPPFGCLFCVLKRPRLCSCDHDNRNGSSRWMKFTHPDVFAEIDRRQHPEDTLLQLTANSGRKMHFRCSKIPTCETCGVEHSWLTWTVVRCVQGSGCPYCAGYRSCRCGSIASNPKLLAEFDRKLNDTEPEKITIASSRLVTWRCSTCKRTWECKPQARTCSDSGCPHCRESCLERFCAEELRSIGVDFETQKRFPDCRDKKPLPFDFFIPGLGGNGAVIELDGPQHHAQIYPTSLLADVQRRDAIKNAYCGKRGFHLLRIIHKAKKFIPKYVRRFVTELQQEGPNAHLRHRYIGEEYATPEYAKMRGLLDVPEGSIMADTPASSAPSSTPSTPTSETRDPDDRKERVGTDDSHSQASLG